MHHEYDIKWVVILEVMKACKPRQLLWVLKLESFSHVYTRYLPLEAYAIPVIFGLVSRNHLNLSK